MEAKDLRIGNWFLADTEENNFKQINANEILDFNDDPLDDYYKPIPLTEEWLLKFGFIQILKDNNGNEYCNLLYSISHKGDLGTIDLDLWKFSGWRVVNSNYKMQYVHQLQNLYFALTQSELTLKN